MYKYITSPKGNKYKIDCFCTIENEKTYVSIETPYFSKIHHLQVYYTPEKTWDQHMGNAPAGYFVIVPLFDGTRKRVYL